MSTSSPDSITISLASNQYYVPSVIISSPAAGELMAPDFTITGTARCKVMKNPSEPEFVRWEDTAIVKVRVKLGSGAEVDATPTGPSATPWTSWRFVVSDRPNGALNITAVVYAGTGTESRSANAPKSVTVDAVGPTVTIPASGIVVQHTDPPTVRVNGTASDASSGVDKVLWRITPWGTFTEASGGTSWSTGVRQLPGPGTYTLAFVGRDNVGNLGTTVTRQVVANDTTAPGLGIDAPSEGEIFVKVGTAPVVVTAHGDASDSQSGVNRVEWALDTQTTFTQATPGAGGSWSTWTAQVSIANPGPHVIRVRARDVAGNTSSEQIRNLSIATPFEPADPEAAFSPAAYLDDLLTFVTMRTKISPASPTLITRDQLATTLLQPFPELVAQANRAIANLCTSQVRLCIVVLRRYLAARVSGTVPAAIQTSYLGAVYKALLLQLGTSYDELRLTRVADNSVRSALAARLGIASSESRPDRLDQLLLEPPAITEVALRDLFGLEETTFKQLTESLLPPPTLLLWQKETVRAAWRDQDGTARNDMDLPVPVLDPDLLSTDDLRTPVAGNVAYNLLDQRRTNLANQLTALIALRGTGAQLTGFDAMVANAVGPVAELLAIENQRQSGSDIDAQLRAKRLTLQAFLHLMRTRQLAAANAVMESEWADVFAILMQVKKLGLYATWRSEELTQNVVLGPDLFKLSDNPQAQLAALPRWRATPQARQAWRRTLQSRIQQQETLTEALRSAVSRAEAAALPQLRDAIIGVIAGARNPSVIAEQLTQELGIDCKTAGDQRTTRVQQAIETLQVIMLSMRLGRLSVPPVLGVNPAVGWKLAVVAQSTPPSPPNPAAYSEADFDEDWRWMGSYASWAAAISVFAYPEAYLLPELNPNKTAAFSILVAQLRDLPRLTAKDAREKAAAYLVAVRAELQDAEPELGEVAPGHVITEQRMDAQLLALRSSIDTLYSPPSSTPSPTLNAIKVMNEIFYFVPLLLALALQKSGQYLAALDWLETIYADHFEFAKRKIWKGLVTEESRPTLYSRVIQSWARVGLNPHTIAEQRAGAHTRFVVATMVRCYLDFADAEFAREETESVARARELYSIALDLLARQEVQPPAAANAFPVNPLPQMLRQRAELNLAKLHGGRNIAGIERDLTPLAQPTLTLDRLPTSAADARSLRPTPYRYSALIERAKYLVNIAQQVEQSFLAALEKRDAEAYNLLKAGHDLQLAGAKVSLQALRVKEAQQGVGLAERQLDRAEVQRDTYQDWLDAGLSKWERDMLGDYRDARRFRNEVAGLDAALTYAQTVASAASGGPFKLLAAPALAGVGILTTLKAQATVQLNNAESSAQINSAMASFERRSQEWALQRQLAESDMAIGAQQIAIAKTHVDISRQEELISRMEQTHTQASVDFLSQKFSNVDLYAWMSGVLGGAYRYFLQQATATAQLAQLQLGFERQEKPTGLIKADYWEVTDGAVAAAIGQDTQPDRRGMTGSIRLLQDITRLDQFAFETNRRKLQLSETLSLARLLPLEFQEFRATGRLPFATPLALFDRGFPGHYLRLIKRVRVSLIALIPPVHGVRATLITSGISRVVIGGNVFQPTVLRRDPELIAFTGPSNASGLLELEPEEGLLLPFEGMGVDTSWELQLPKAANPFDFRSIADVLFTLEYTALADFAYRRQVIEELEDAVSAERVFSLRDQFADQWYGLHNAEPEAPLVATFRLRPQDFPPNVLELRIQLILLFVVRADGQTFELDVTQLKLRPDGETVAVGGAVGGSTDGLISTRRGNAAAWLPMLGRSPVGLWELTLSNTEQMRARFRDEQIEDLLLVLTYDGSTPPWPL